MSFDLATAKPVEAAPPPPTGKKGGFDLSTAKPAEEDTNYLKEAAGYFVEPALAVGSGALGSVVGGLAGAGRAMLPGEEGIGAKTAQSTQEALTYQPRTKAGKAGLGAFQSVVGPPMQALEHGADVVGQKQAESKFGSPATGALTNALMQFLPQLLAPELLGGAARGVKGAVGRGAENLKRGMVEKQITQGRAPSDITDRLNDPQIPGVKPDLATLTGDPRDIATRKLAQGVTTRTGPNKGKSGQQLLDALDAQNQGARLGALRAEAPGTGGAETVVQRAQAQRGALEKSAADTESSVTAKTQAMLDQARQAGERGVSEAEQAGRAGVAEAEGRLPGALEPGEAGGQVRDTLQTRKDIIDEHIKTETQPLRDAAFASEGDVSKVLSTIESRLEGPKREIGAPERSTLEKARAAIKRAMDEPEVVEAAPRGNPLPAGVRLETLTPKAKETWRAAGFDVGDAAPAAKPVAPTGTVGGELLYKARRAVNDLRKEDLADGGIIDQIVADLDKAGSPQHRALIEKERELYRMRDPYNTQVQEGQKAGGALTKDQFNRDFLSSPESVPAKFFKAGDEGAAGIRQLKNSSGEAPAVMDAMRGYVSGKVRNMDPAAKARFAEQHRGALQELGMYDDLAGVGRAGEAAEAGLRGAKEAARAGESAAKQQAGTITERLNKRLADVKGKIKASVLSRITDETNAVRAKIGGDYQRTLEKAFYGETREADLRELVTRMKGDPQALAGLRQAARESFEVTRGDGTPDLAGSVKRYNEIRPALESSGLFEAPHLQALDKIMRSMDDAAKVQAGSKFDVTQGLKPSMGMVGNVLGWVTKGAAGAFVGRTLGIKAFERLQSEVHDAVLQIAIDPSKYTELTKPVTRQSLSALQDLITKEYYPDLGQAFKLMAAGEGSKERKPNPFSMRPGGL